MSQPKKKRKYVLHGRKSRSTPYTDPSDINCFMEGESIERYLEQQIYTQATTGQQPIVKLKDVDPEAFSGQEKVILISTSPFPETDGYEQAVLYAGYRSLAQWNEAGLGSQYPNEERVFAEIETVNFANGKTRKETTITRNAQTRLRDNLSNYNEEINKTDCDTAKAERYQWAVNRAILVLNNQNEAAAFRRLSALNSTMRRGLIITPEGIYQLKGAKLLALSDSLPKKQCEWLPRKLQETLRLNIGFKIPIRNIELPLQEVELTDLRWNQAKESGTFHTWKHIASLAHEMLEDTTDEQTSQYNEPEGFDTTSNETLRSVSKALEDFNMTSKETIQSVRKALEAVRDIECPDGDNEGEPLNARDVYDYLSKTDQEKVTRAHEACFNYTRHSSGEPNVRAINTLEKNGFPTRLDEHQYDNDRLVGSVKLGTDSMFSMVWEIDISDPH